MYSVFDCCLCKLTSSFSDIKQILWKNRKVADNGSACRVTVDGTDFQIFEPTPFDPKWYSHKFKGPGVRYEIGICIQTGWIVWVNGPFPCGSWPDLRIARDWLIYELEAGEMYCADGGYLDGNQYSVTPNGLNNEDQRMRSLARARHETVNRRFKEFDILGRRFRHNVVKHGVAFMAVANITQLTIMHGQPLFSVEYDENEV
jgi:hypothetical protein